MLRVPGSRGCRSKLFSQHVDGDAYLRVVHTNLMADNQPSLFPERGRLVAQRAMYTSLIFRHERQLREHTSIRDRRRRQIRAEIASARRAVTTICRQIQEIEERERCRVTSHPSLLISPERRIEARQLPQPPDGLHEVHTLVGGFLTT